MKRRNEKLQSSFIENSRYQYEFANERNVGKSAKKDANSSIARGANLQGAFTNPLPVEDVEFAEEHDIKSNNIRTKQKFQEDLQQNYGVELSEEFLINKNRNE